MYINIIYKDIIRIKIKGTNMKIHKKKNEWFPHFISSSHPPTPKAGNSWKPSGHSR